MNSLIQNYEIILKALAATRADIPCFHQNGKPELSNLELAAPASDSISEFLCLPTKYEFN